MRSHTNSYSMIYIFTDTEQFENRRSNTLVRMDIFLISRLLSSSSVSRLLMTCPRYLNSETYWMSLSPIFNNGRGYWRQRAEERFGDPPPRWIHEPSVARDCDGRPPRGPLAVHCFCVCSGSVLLGDLLGVSRSRKSLVFRLSCRFILGFSCAYSLCIVA